MAQAILPVVLSGGSGSRLWPVSRDSHPKQFLDLQGRGTMLRATIDRLAPLGSEMLILCAEPQRFRVAEALREAERTARIVLEPVARNTALPAAVAALIAAARDPQTVLLIAPADHHIPDDAAFRAAATQAAELASADHIVTFGITPDSPETGYGYIRRGDRLSPHGSRVAAFSEKPDRARAEAFLSEGGYFWNAGIFAAPAGLLLAEIEAHAPEVVVAARAALARAVEDLDFLRLAAGPLADCPSISIDHAVMERTDRAAMLSASFAWSDLGSWNALWQIGADSAKGNALSGNVIVERSTGSYVRSEGPLVAVAGVSDLVVVATSDAVLVTDRRQSEAVKDLLMRLKKAGHPEATEHRRVHRPWGSYESLALGERFQVKRIVVRPGGILSLQSHMHRAEHWVVVSGTAQVTIGAETAMLTENQSVFVPLGARHRLANPGKVDLVLIEVQSGPYLGEDDITRYEDVYARN